MNFSNLRQHLIEKTLTPAEKKKREEVAKAIERENPDMPMPMKMAIATKTAKRVAEGEELDEASYQGKGNHRPGWMLRADPELAKKFKEKQDAYKARVKAYGNPAAGKSVKEQADEDLNELDKSTISSYVAKAKKDVKELKPFVKKGQSSIAQRITNRRKSGLEMAKTRMEEVESVEEADNLALRGLHTANPHAIPNYMRSTEKGKKSLADKNKSVLKDLIKRQLGKHPKANLPEEIEVVSELKKETLSRYMDKTVDPVYGMPRSPKKLKQRLAGISRAHQRLVGNKPTSEEVVQVDELKKSTVRGINGY